MQRTPPTTEEIAEWQQIFKEYRPRLRANGKSPEELLAYLLRNYPLTEQTDETLQQIVTDNILWNEVYREKLPTGLLPEPRVFIVESKDQGLELYRQQTAEEADEQILVGLDMVSGYYMVEGSSGLWDELNAFKGLDKYDLENFFCVAEYVKNARKFGYLVI